MKKILHIANDFLGSAVYSNLFENISRKNMEQEIYTAYNPTKIGSINSECLNLNNCKITISPILNLYCRVNFKYKIKKILSDILKKVDMSTFNVIHAHTWYSDGAVAYELYKKYGIKYVITVRNTDINIFFKYFIHLRSYGLEILNSAEKIIFISPNYKNRLFSNRIFINNNLEFKSIVIPNGVDPFWINNIDKKREAVTDEIKILFVGKFDKGKNVKRLIDAVKLINDKKKSVKLSLVGGGGDQHKAILKYIVDKSCYIKYLGKLNKENLKVVYREHNIFVMPSLFETFGLVYIEALLQGLPVIYTKGEGIDGYYNDSIGEKVNPKSISDIHNKIIYLHRNYARYNYDVEIIKARHSWDKIADEYLNNVYKAY